MTEPKKSLVGDFLYYAKNHRILIHSQTRMIGIRDTLIGWGLIGLATVLFQNSFQKLSTELNYFIQFFSAFLILGIAGFFKGIGFLKIQNEKKNLYRFYEEKAHLTPKERVIFLVVRSIIAVGGYMQGDFMKKI